MTTTSHNDDLQASHNILQLLEESNANVENILDQLPGIFLIINENNEILRNNNGVCELLKIENEELFRQELSILFRDETWEKFKSNLQELRKPDACRETINFELGIFDSTSYEKEHYWFLTKLKVYSPGEGRLIAIIGEDISELRCEIRKKMDDLHALNTAGETLATQHVQQEALRVVLNILNARLNIEKASVYLLHDEELVISTFAPELDNLSANQHPQKFRLGEGIAGKAAEIKDIIFVPNTSCHPDYVTDQSTIESEVLLCIPMLDKHGVFGVMNLSGEAGKVNFEKEDHGFVLTIARMAAITTKNIQMVDLIEEHNRTLEKKVIERTSAIKNLMDNAGEGFLSFGETYLIDPEYSKPCQIFFDGPIGALNVLQLIFATDPPTARELLEAEQTTPQQLVAGSDSVKELLDMIFSGMGDLSVFGDFLPKEIEVQHRTLELDYRLIKSTNAPLKIMVIVTDVSKERGLALQIAKDKVLHSMIVKVALDREGFIQFLKEVEKLFSFIYESLANDPDSIDVNELFRYYHTLKGGSACYGFRDFSVYIHEIEARLETIRSGQDVLTKDLVLRLLEDSISSQQIFAEALDGLGSIVSEEERRETDRYYKIREEKVVHLEEFLFSKLSEDNWKYAMTLFREIRKQPIGPVLKKYVAAAEGLAGRLNKPIEIQVIGMGIEIAHDKLDDFFGTLIHLVRNAVDHGLESVETRISSGKPEAGKLVIEAKTNQQDLIIRISDDGGGVDIETVKKIALQKQLITTEYARNATEEELVMLLFAPGFSTKEVISDISGRGVGMDAVKTAITQLNGTIQIKTDMGQGTTFEILIPNVA